MIRDFIRALSRALCDREQSVEPPAVALIGGATSIAVALAVRAAGLSVQPYAVTFGERPPPECHVIAGHLKKELRVFELPSERLSADFVHLAMQHRCFAIGDYEMGLLALHLCEALREKEIWLPVQTNRAGWKTAIRIGTTLGKTLVNPLALLPADSGLQESELERALWGELESPHDL